MKIPTSDNEFLPVFYKILAVTGVVGVLAALLIGDVGGPQSFACGAVFAFLIVFLWDFSLSLALNPKNPSPGLGSLLIFLHYGLLAGLFYVMISLFDVSWFWFLSGTVILLPSLLFAVFFTSQRETEKN